MLNFYDFVNNNQMFRQFRVDELLFTAYDCPFEDERLDYWTKNNYFFYIIKGGLKWKTPRKEYTMGAGDAVFVKRGAHTVYKVIDGDLCGLLIFIPDEFIKAVFQKHMETPKYKPEGLPTDSIIPLELDEILLNYFNSVLHYFSMSVPPSNTLLEIRFKELIINILTGGNNRLLARFFGEICCEQKRSMKTVMEDNYAFNLKLLDYAKLSNRSLATFKRDFRKIYDTSPGKWLKSKRLQHAKFLLETTDLNISEITMESGFENTSHFIRSFKERYKHPPLHFKKRLQAN